MRDVWHQFADAVLRPWDAHKVRYSGMRAHRLRMNPIASGRALIWIKIRPQALTHGLRAPLSSLDEIFSVAGLSRPTAFINMIGTVSTMRTTMLDPTRNIALAYALSALAGYVDGIGFIHLGGCSFPS